MDGKVFVGGCITADEQSEGGGYKVLEYCREKWTEIETLVRGFGLAVVHNQLNNQLMITGGEDKEGDPTDQVSVLEGRKWNPDVYPNMHSARILPSAIGYKSWVVVVGGRDESGVEVLDTSANMWYRASPLHLKACRPSLTAIQDTLYVTWGTSFACVFLPILLSDAISRRYDESSEWHILPGTFTYDPALTSFNGNLLAVGAWHTPDDTIAMYLPQTGQWLKVAKLRTKRQGCTCIELPTRAELMVIGGGSDKSVETCYLMKKNYN